MLVGGGELHDRWESLLAVRAPLSRGIQRFTGISQAMVDEAPPAPIVLPELAELHARPRARRPQRRVRPPRARARPSSAPAWRGPTPPVLCTVALARRLHPLARQRKLRAAGRVARDRGRGHPPRAGRRRDVRARVLRAVPAAVRARADGRATRSRCCARRARAAGARGRPTAPRRASAARTAGCPTSRTSPTSPASTSCATPRARPLYVGKSVRVRSRARAHFAAVVDRERLGRRRPRRSSTSTRSPSSARCCSRAGWSRRLRPPGNARLKQRSRPLRLPALPPGHRRSRCSRWRTAPAEGRGVSRRPAARPRDGRRAARAAQLAVRPAPLRARPAAARSGRAPTGRWGAACRRAWATSTRTSTAAASTRRSRCSAGAATAARALLAHVDAQMRAAAAAERFERAAWLRRRRERLSWLLERLGDDGARRTPGRGSCSPPTRRARATTRCGWSAGASSTGGRWATSTTSPSARAPRCAAATARGTVACLSPDEVSEARIVSTWLDRNPSPALDLTGGADRERLSRLGAANLTSSPVRGIRSGSTRRCGSQLRIEDGVAPAAPGARDPSSPGLTRASARARPTGASRRTSSPQTGDAGAARRRERQLDTTAVAPPACSSSPGAASRRTSASAIGPRRGETTLEATRPTSRSPSDERGAGRDRLAQAQAAQVAVGLAAPVQARDGLLADVAALGEAHVRAR